MFQDPARQYYLISKDYNQCMPKQDYRESPFPHAFFGITCSIWSTASGDWS